jgi:hypothetical protein
MPTLKKDIDPDDMVNEWIEQEAQHRAWQKHLADVQDAFDRAKAALELTRIKLDLKVRKHPDDFSLSPKPSNDAVASAVGSDPKHKAAVDNFLDKKQKLGMTKAAVESLYSRDKALQKITDLYIHEYYASKRNVDHDDDGGSEERRAVRRRAKERSDGRN